MKKVRLIELFAGVGSQAMALRDIGADFEHYKVVEFDKFAIKSYNAIHGTDFKPIDIQALSGKDLGIVDTDKYTYIMTYSFPCQDLSLAGKQKGMSKGDGTRSGLLWEVERLLNETEKLPQVLLMENVLQVHDKKNLPDFEKWLQFLAGKGYRNYWQDLNAVTYGVAQNRSRCFMVSLLGGTKYNCPESVRLTKTLKDYLENDVDEKYYLNRDVTKLIEKIGKVDKVEKTEVIRLGGLYDTDTKRHQIGSVYDKNGLAPTLDTMQGGNREPIIVETINGYRLRKLTPKECWRLMGFSDDDFEKAAAVNSNTQLYKQAGNSIVKPVLMAIFDKIIGLGALK